VTPPVLRPAYQRDLAIVRQAMGSERFDAARMTGSAMTLDRLVEYARQVDTTPRPRVVSADPLSRREGR